MAKKQSIPISFLREIGGPTETISATVPTVLVRNVRDRVGPREFSQFVTRAITRELVRLNREAFVADVVKATGPLDSKEVAAWRKVIAKH